MIRRITAAILALVTALSLVAVPANAAASLDEAMQEVNVFARNNDLDWLRVNGAVKTQHYTYYVYRSELTGQTTEIPAYCTDPRLYGVPALVPEGNSIKYGADGTVTDPKIMGICANGYPHIDLDTLGLSSIEEAYYATKTALWCYLLSTWSIDSLSVNPNADQAAAQRVLQATRNIYNRGMQWDKLVEPKFTATPDRDTAYAATVNGESVYQQIRPELPPLPVRPRIPGVPHHGLRRHLRGAGAKHRGERRHQRRNLDVYGLYGAAVLHAFQNRQSLQEPVRGALILLLQSLHNTDRIIQE